MKSQNTGFGQPQIPRRGFLLKDGGAMSKLKKPIRNINILDRISSVISTSNTEQYSRVKKNLDIRRNANPVRENDL